MDFIEARNAAAREIALALGVPPMLLGIPGDNTYSNYREASRTFWRQTVLPLVNRAARALSSWLAPAFGSTSLRLVPDLDQIEALAPEREVLWTRLDAATFLTPNEKRIAAGYPPLDGGDALAQKFNPWHDPSNGQFTSGLGGGVQPIAFRPPRGPSKPPAPAKPAPATPPPKKLEDILKPGGNEVGYRNKGAGERIRTLDSTEFDRLQRELIEGAKEVAAPMGYVGKWYQRADGTIIGMRDSVGSGPTIEVIEGRSSGLKNGYKVHKK
jgi:hypothetical protein